MLCLVGFFRAWTMLTESRKILCFRRCPESYLKSAVLRYQHEKYTSYRSESGTDIMRVIHVALAYRLTSLMLWMECGELFVADHPLASSLFVGH